MEFQIPKQTDRQLLSALITIRESLRDLRPLAIRVSPYENASQIDLPDNEPEKVPTIEYILAEESEIMMSLILIDPTTNEAAITITRQFNKITDSVTINQANFIRQLLQDKQNQFSVKRISLARKHLRAPDAEANLFGGSDNEWTRYRDSQQTILNSLQETQKSILTEFTRKSLEMEAAAKTRYDNLEIDLQKRYETAQTQLEQEHKARLDLVLSKEAENKKREESFNTKEARYVARQEQQNQIKQIKDWLENWSITKGTRSKRWPVIAAYTSGIALTGFLAVLFSIQNFRILEGKDLSQVAWWQWAILSLKSIFPVAAFITFIVYFIRWSAAWARQHAEEEFRNRARVLDIGRASWLLEAVRDAQDNQKRLPPELLKELSRNLFTYTPFTDGSDVHPQSISDLILQGLGSIRVKNSDGTEVEATRVSKRGKES